MSMSPDAERLLRSVFEPEEKRESTASSVLGCLVTCLVAIASVPLRGWVIQELWGWFATPVFHVVAPSLALCIGLVLLARMILGRSGDDNSSNDRTNAATALYTVGNCILGPLLIYGLAYLVHAYWV